jgi:hypothetical protein
MCVRLISLCDRRRRKDNVKFESTSRFRCRFHTIARHDGLDTRVLTYVFSSTNIIEHADLDWTISSIFNHDITYAVVLFIVESFVWNIF